MIQTMLASPEHVATMKATGVYGHLLHYAQTVSRGEAAPKLPGEAQGQGQAPAQGQGQGKPKSNTTLTVSQSQVGTGADRAMNYFSACLRILGLEEEVALTEELLKTAYKTSAKRAHPDKGGSEKEFEAVTKAYAYLGEILRRIHGGRTAAGKVEAPATLAAGREATAFKHVEPVRLNPKNLDLNSFNKLYEETRLPDPDETGYGDWLKGGDSAAGDSATGTSGPKFGGKFNRDVFHKAFEEEQQAKAPSWAWGKARWRQRGWSWRTASRRGCPCGSLWACQWERRWRSARARGCCWACKRASPWRTAWASA